MSLVSVVDLAFPIDVGKYPADVKAVAGYVGMAGCTPHIWTDAEIAAVTASGREWWGIVVPPQRGLAPSDGVNAARAMLTRFAELHYTKTYPAFIDIEHSSYVANPSGAMAAVAAWRKTMAAAGYLKTYPYLPFIANQGWIAHWTNERPTTLPQGWIGDQYGGGPGYDLDVFDSSLFPTPVLPVAAPITEDDDDMTPQDMYVILTEFFAPVPDPKVDHSGQGYKYLVQAAEAAIKAAGVVAPHAALSEESAPVETPTVAPEVIAP